MPEKAFFLHGTQLNGVNDIGIRCYDLHPTDKVNRASIEEIQRCIFLVSLDGPVVNPTGNEMNDAALNCVHGNGPQAYAGNRWYDKTIQVSEFLSSLNGIESLLVCLGKDFLNTQGLLWKLGLRWI